jgi:hypothetical protein
MRVLMFVPILMGMTLIVGGAVSEKDAMIWAGLGLIGAAAIVLIVLKARVISAAQAERKRIWKTGRPATAKVVKIVEVGGDDQPEIDLDLEVLAEGAPATSVKVRSLISRIAITRIQPGCEIQLRVDPADVKKVVIDPGLTPYRMD